MEKLSFTPEQAREILKQWTEHAEEAAMLLKALGHPARVLILQIIRQSQCNVTTLEQALGISQSSASQHLRVLRMAGLVEPLREGKEICYRIVDERVFKILDIFYS
ncbi:ArsR/SmtB family transcription factor [Thermospira aquatica]|uniref:Metalloregulator ArsR/SmtB family transcription factor n=1 Tax=Thermospira aquatica TaxID=2828656 RepID=A0AAX3BCJ9_9SPIR|nr:metalloregulator ArsR/SmtB family transcription factor [Thermospira aquatica]URA09968.1 metalloregulator ArsR/SmtB family transcription factor [Thermospira aquatica]